MEIAWAEVYERLSGAESDELSSVELESLADAAFWLGRPRESIAARHKAYEQHVRERDDGAATKAAWHMFSLHFDLDETSVASGWLTRAIRHAQQVPERVEPGYVALAESDFALYQDRLDDAFASTERAIGIGQRFGDRDLEAIGLATQGRMLVARGDVVAGLSRLDEAMVTALSDTLTPFATGWVLCVLLYVCEQIGDVRRAAEWSDLAMRWGDEHGHYSWFPGTCRLHRCAVDSFRGEWARAEREAARAVDELSPYAAYLIAEGFYLTGEIRLRRGEFATAEQAFQRTSELGRSPHPGLALLRLAQGDVDAAAAALKSALTARQAGPLQRGRLLAAYIQAELRRGNADAARKAADELDDIAAANLAPLLRAIAATSRAAVVIDTDVDGAMRYLGEARQLYQELSAPYDIADTRVQLGIAVRRMGDEETARMEFDAALIAFERLGAVPDMQRVRGLLGGAGVDLHGMSERELEVLRLVAQGRSNREIAADLVISEHTVARHVSNIFNKIDVTSRSAATSFAYEHDLT